MRKQADETGAGPSVKEEKLMVCRNCGRHRAKSMLKKTMIRKKSPGGEDIVLATHVCANGCVSQPTSLRTLHVPKTSFW